MTVGHHRRRRRSRGGLAAGALLAATSLALLVAGLFLVAGGHIPAIAPGGQAGPGSAGQSPLAVAGGTGPAGPARAATAMAPAAPLSLDIPSIEVRSTLPGTGLNHDRTIAVPPVTTPQQAAWYTGAPQPGALGPAIIVGHVNGDGRDGVFADLADLTPGNQVLITRADHSVAPFTVTRVETAPKNRFPTRAVYGDTPGPELRLITCGGVFDREARSYESNVIVYAALTGTEPTSSRAG